MGTDEFIQGVGYPRPFDELAVDLCDTASRYICILSPALDPAVFDSDILALSLSRLARSSRQTEIRILIADSRSLVGRGHRLLSLSRRIPSSLQIRRLQEHPDWGGQTLVIRDRDGVLYKPGGSDKDGFYEPASRASTARHLELFNELWRFSEADPNLRSINL